MTSVLALSEVKTARRLSGDLFFVPLSFDVRSFWAFDFSFLAVFVLETVFSGITNLR